MYRIGRKPALKQSVICSRVERQVPGGYATGACGVATKGRIRLLVRYLRFKRWLDELALLAGEPQAVYFEEVRRHAGVDAAHAYG
jgi:hypothetical protein